MSPCRILVVDDDATASHLLGELLAGDDRIVVTAANAKEAYRRYLEQRPDVLVIDLALPGEGGIDIAAQLLEVDPAATVVVYSAFVDPAVRRRAEKIGVRACIEKPSTDDLLAFVAQQCAAP